MGRDWRVRTSGAGVCGAGTHEVGSMASLENPEQGRNQDELQLSPPGHQGCGGCMGARSQWAVCADKAIRIIRGQANSAFQVSCVVCPGKCRGWRRSIFSGTCQSEAGPGTAQPLSLKFRLDARAANACSVGPAPF